MNRIYMQVLKLTIGNLNIQLEGIDAKDVPRNTQLFCNEFEVADLKYFFRIGENPPVIKYPVIYQTNEIVVLGKPEGREARILYTPNTHNYYGYYEEIGEKEIVVYVDERNRKSLQIDTIFISLLALERQEALKGAFVLHCAYMVFGNNVILFSGPSGIGKSTHSSLWCREYPGEAHVLNGDKCLLTFEKGIFYANGWPVCGSSGICHNKKHAVSCIILLQQAMINQFVEKKNISNFKQILAQITVNYWNNNYINQTIDFIDSLLQQVKCGIYACNISSEAVVKLNNELKKRAWIC